MNGSPDSPRKALIPLGWALVASFWLAILTPPYPVEPLPVGIAALMQGAPSAYRSAASRLARYAFLNSDLCAPDATIGFVSLCIPHAVGPNAVVPRVNRAPSLAPVLSSRDARAPPA